jgi:hypothetical protein
MSSKSFKNHESQSIEPEHTKDTPLGMVLSDVMIPISSLLHKKNDTENTLPSGILSTPSIRSPYHLAILKIEFEDACKDFSIKPK